MLTFFYYYYYSLNLYIKDYLDAFEKLMKLGLTEVQQREIPRVLLQCIGNVSYYICMYLCIYKFIIYLLFFFEY